VNFDQAFTRLLGHEGSYSSHAADPGGQTMWGVTEAVARSNGFQGSMRDLPQDFAKSVYYNGYWKLCRCDELPVSIRFDVFDGAVNSGVSQSIKWLQRALGVREDGVIGPQTLAAAQSASNLAQRYTGQRLMFMTNLPTWPAFGKGWARRIASNLIGAA